MEPGQFRRNRATYLWIGILVGLMILLAGCQKASPAATTAQNSGNPKAVQVEVIYLNHPPVKPVVQEIDQLLAGYADQVQETKYDFDTKEGEAFAKQKGLTGHIPLVVFVNGSEEFDLNGRKVKFESFPQGEGTGMVPDGAWTIKDLQSVLDSKVKK
jgi:hypothetical protein